MFYSKLFRFTPSNFVSFRTTIFFPGSKGCFVLLSVFVFHFERILIVFLGWVAHVFFECVGFLWFVGFVSLSILLFTIVCATARDAWARKKIGRNCPEDQLKHLLGKEATIRKITAS